MDIRFITKYWIGAMLIGIYLKGLSGALMMLAGSIVWLLDLIFSEFGD